ncbi:MULTISPECIES: divalent-cation tolerance protein CutA [Burkholderiaceae]|uniref:divalent-cation tolerance protein CutA n=1 Tax=Burkholderiaceae TaxID=119060 RepID=UPI00095CC199|nr:MULTISPECIES: divalent-cation tolerance protein CutA [Burkholderiaceae]MCF2133343.1 divalent-cation tolerance protein CutA [Mycetohabitans sp. B3]MCG1017982.1 divalent-cation tolerance protein CutA [Mycetohabitans sp. B4]SIT69941.1 divalent cation tolerance protein [Burkholderia sp. b13]
MMPEEHVTSTVILMLTTLPDAQAASTLARTVLDARLAACATQLAPSRSVYHWQGELEHADEVPLLFKTAVTRAFELEKFIAANHPYQTPEILSWSAASSPAYALWVDTETSRPTYV